MSKEQTPTEHSLNLYYQVALRLFANRGMAVRMHQTLLNLVMFFSITGANTTDITTKADQEAAKLLVADLIEVLERHEKNIMEVRTND